MVGIFRVLFILLIRYLFRVVYELVKRLYFLIKGKPNHHFALVVFFLNDGLLGTEE